MGDIFLNKELKSVKNMKKQRHHFKREHSRIFLR
jgi:hypothetical protein